MNKDFLSRWSRRKLEAEADEQSHAAPAAEAPQTPEAESSPVSADDELTAEELAALPAIEELTTTSDFAAFLRKGVPLVLRNAALRRMWVLDPAIRDFVGDARDYAWDWNTPGGVPVSGPLAEGTDVQAMVRRIIGQDREEASQPARENVIAEQKSSETEAELPRRRRETTQAVEDQQNIDAEAAREPDETDPSSPKRHGSALPA